MAPLGWSGKENDRAAMNDSAPTWVEHKRLPRGDADAIGNGNAPRRTVPLERALRGQDDEDDEDDELLQTPTPRAKKRVANGDRAQPSVSFQDQEDAAENMQMRGADDGGATAIGGGAVRRNRLEERLEELQRDVASLTMRLRTTGAAAKTAQAQHMQDPARGIGRNRAAAMPEPMPRDRDRDRERHRVTARDHTPPLKRRLFAAKEAAEDEDDDLLDEEEPLDMALHPRRTIGAQSSKPHRSTAVPVPSDVRRARASRVDGGGHTTTATANGNVNTSIGGRSGVGTPSRVATRALRELQTVAVERDRLRFELDQVKRALGGLEKKYHGALKWREAYERMKENCISLQESLDLSEKIRMRQKKLLQQLQHAPAPVPAPVPASRVAKKERERRSNATSTAMAMAMAASHPVDVLESVLEGDTSASQRRMRRPLEELDMGTTTRQRRQPTIAQEPSFRSQARSDFDSYLQLPPGRVPHVKPVDQSRLSTLSKNPLRSMAVAAAPANTSRVVRTKPSNVSFSTRKPTTPRGSHFLAPTMASLAHMHPRHVNAPRRPFVV